MSKTAEVAQFLKNYNALFGENIESLNQIIMDSFNGLELYTLVDFCLAQQSSSKDARIKELEARLEKAEKLVKDISEYDVVAVKSVIPASYWDRMIAFLTNKTEGDE